MRCTNRFLSLLTVLFLVGCTISKTICPCEAPEIIRMGDKEIEISAWLSMIDTTAAGGMKVRIWLTTLEHTPMPTNFTADYYYLRSSNPAREAFEGKFTKTNTDITRGIMELEATNAPRWAKGELVDVAVHMIDSRGKVHFLKKDAVAIEPPTH